MWIGIDPGSSGGFAFISGEDVEAFVTPLHDKEDRKKFGNPIDWMSVYRGLRNWKKSGTKAVVEQAQAMPGNGVSSMFKYGASFGGILTVLQSLSIPYTLVRPSVWKRSLLGQAEEGEAKKARAIAYCQERWPHFPLRRTARCTTEHDGLADALCLAAWGETHGS